MTSPGKMLDLDGMEAVARAAAVRAPWRHEQYHRVLDAEGTPICKPYGKTFGEQDAYGEHIATFDPPTVLALIQTQRELVGALKGLLTFFSPPDEDSLERFERIAAEFHRETGMLAPGKSEPMDSSYQGRDEERRERYYRWLAERVDVARTATAKALGEQPL